ncbi:MAG TPA: DUF2334 domain-containing protein [Dyella sp.]|uniref:DUF2334 domain-containing protein n=1 Tax=Dyella sp. TaxID=1869338 RepID=UPI002B8E4768|nr:DUF2334 domain-containing protein [Dyella sp.]HUB91693.1 DUF2334 domain-containing protein [Dyella sp.]
MFRPSFFGPSRFQSLLAGIALVLLAVSSPISVAAQGTLMPSLDRAALPAPPPPPHAALPKVQATVTQAPRVSTTLARTVTAAAASAPNAYAGAPGANPNQNTLVLYDITGQWGWLGEAYGVMAGNLVTHGSKYTLQPAVNYVSGELNSYTGLIYIGSTYGEPLPTALLDDVLATTKPVLWMNDNIWQLSARAANFAGQYGFTPTYFDFSNTLTVTYKNIALQRNALAVPSGLLQTTINDPTKAQVLAVATNDTNGSINWATKGANLTYIGEIPFSYTGPNDRYLAAIDLIGKVSNPNMPARKRALVRIEDVDAEDDPTQLRAIADYLYSKNVPFSVALIPYYVDPNGFYNNGVPVSIHLYQAKTLVSALKYMQARGGVMMMHGYTHQYSNIDNPYTGVSGDDFEFYTAHIDASNSVIFDSPVPVDSMSWAQGRITAGFQEFSKAGLIPPTIFVPPHYAASAIDYAVFKTQFEAMSQRDLYAIGWCPNGACGTGTPDYTRIYGQFYPYLVRNVFGSVVLPEQLGDVELVEYNNNPPRFPADILYSANCNTVIQDSVQSFFIDPTLDISYLKQIVEGLQAMGYTFVSVSVITKG